MIRLNWFYKFFIFVTFFNLFFVSNAAYSQENAANSSVLDVNSTAEQDSVYLSDPKSWRYSAGIFMGHLLHIDPQGQSIFVKPIKQDKPRRTFYLSDKTIFTEIESGDKRKKRRLENFIEGQKVAVRYISEGQTFVADEVFLVKGEFQPKEYEKIRKKASSKKKGK